VKKIIILTDTGFSKRDYDRFFVEKLSKVYDVLVLDLAPYLNKKIFNLTLKNQKIFQYKNYVTVKSFKEFEDFLATNKKSFNYAFDFISARNKDSFYFKKFLKSIGIRLVFFQFGLVPNIIRTNKEKILRLFRLLKNPNLFIKKIYSIINTRLRDRIFQKIKYDYIFISGTKGVDNQYAKKATKKIFTHSSDYENILNYSFSKINFDNYFVFLDQNLPFHPAQFYRDEKPQVTSKKYFPSLALTFKKLEKKFESKILISAHPRADISDYNNFFKGRQIFNSKTIDLVKNCRCVLAHTTTAISYAVIFKKPIIFLTSNEIIKSYDDYRVHSNARILKSKFLNIDTDNDKYIYSADFNLNINENQYEIFLEKFIKHPSSNERSIIDNIKENLN